MVVPPPQASSLIVIAKSVQIFPKIPILHSLLKDVLEREKVITTEVAVSSLPQVVACSDTLLFQTIIPHEVVTPPLMASTSAFKNPLLLLLIKTITSVNMIAELKVNVIANSLLAIPSPLAQYFDPSVSPTKSPKDIFAEFQVVTPVFVIVAV